MPATTNDNAKPETDGAGQVPAENPGATEVDTFTAVQGEDLPIAHNHSVEPSSVVGQASESGQESADSGDKSCGDHTVEAGQDKDINHIGLLTGVGDWTEE